MESLVVFKKKIIDEEIPSTFHIPVPKGKNPQVPSTFQIPVIRGKNVASTPDTVSLSSPNLTEFAGYLYVIYREKDDSCWVIESTNGQTWGTPYKILKTLVEPGYVYNSTISTACFTIYSPGICKYGSYCWMSYVLKGTNFMGLCRSADPSGQAWTGQPLVSIPDTPASGPSMAVLNRLFLLYRNSDGNMKIGHYNGSWGTFISVVDSNNLSYVTDDGPFLMATTEYVSLPARLYIAFKNTNTVYVGYATMDSDGYTITGWTMNTVSTPVLAMGSPSLAQYDDKIYLSFQGADQLIHYAVSNNNGVSWTDWSSMPMNMTIGRPAMYQLDTDLTMAFSGFSLDDGKKFLYTTYHTFTSGSDSNNQ